MYLITNSTTLLFDYEEFRQAGWITIDGLIVILIGGLGWSLIACAMVAVAIYLRNFLPQRLSHVRFVTLPYSIDALSTRRFILAETLFLLHSTLVCCLWFAAELVGRDSWFLLAAHYSVTYLDWPLYLLNLTFWNQWGEENIFAGTMLSSLIFGTAIYTFLGWFVEVFVNQSLLHQKQQGVLPGWI